jgi:hypothetical protein
LISWINVLAAKNAGRIFPKDRQESGNVKRIKNGNELTFSHYRSRERGCSPGMEGEKTFGSAGMPISNSFALERDALNEHWQAGVVWEQTVAIGQIFLKI